MTLLAALQKTTKALRDLCVDGQDALIMTEDADVRIASLYLGPTPSGEHVLEDCEDAWTASANVTDATEATIKKVGTNSRKLTIAAGFTTGVIAYEDISEADISDHDYIAVWLRSNTALDAGVLSLVIDETSGCASPSEEFEIPAMDADTWHRFVWPLTADAADLNAIISVGLKANADPGAIILYVDDVRVTDANRTAKNVTLATSGHWHDVLPHGGADHTDADIGPGVVTPDFTARWMSATTDKDMLLTLMTSEDEADLFVPSAATYEFPWPVEISGAKFEAEATVDSFRFFFAGRGS